MIRVKNCFTGGNSTVTIPIPDRSYTGTVYTSKRFFTAHQYYSYRQCLSYIGQPRKGRARIEISLARRSDTTIEITGSKSLIQQNNHCIL